MVSEWRPIAKEYNPLKAGSIDGTDTEPHDRAVWRAMNAHYVPADVDTKPSHTLFVGRLPHNVEEEQLHQKFSKFGVVERICLIRDVVTGHSKGYCFVEYRKERDAEHALRESSGLQINGCPVIIDREAGHRVKGWVPRRLGGGWGGRKEAGQLRFGCRDRPWRKPIVIQQSRTTNRYPDNTNSTNKARYQDSPSSAGNRHGRSSHRSEGRSREGRDWDGRDQDGRDRATWEHRRHKHRDRDPHSP